VSNPQAVQQIGTLLTQSGVPSGISLDIAQRILTATGGAGSPPSRTITSAQAKNSSFYNDFKPPEATAKPTDEQRQGRDGIGKKGRDGILAILGKDGKDGADGGLGDQIQQWFEENITNIGPSIEIVYPNDLGPLWAAINDLRRRMDTAETNIKNLQTEVRSLKGRVAQLFRRVRRIEAILEDTVDC